MNNKTDYDDGVRDAKLDTHAEQLKALWIEVKNHGTWQNRAIGYITALATAGSLLLGLLIKKLGWA